MPKWRSSGIVSVAYGAGNAVSCGGSASCAIPCSDRAPLCVQAAATSGATNAPARRKFALLFCCRSNLANCCSVKKPTVEETFDPEVVAAVEAKLQALGVDDDPPTSEPEAT
jgi:hypothetical protein